MQQAIDITASCPADHRAYDSTAQDSENLFPPPSFFDPTMPDDWCLLNEMQSVDVQGIFHLLLCSSTTET